MAARIPLVLNSGKVEQLQSGDTISFVATIISDTTLYVATTGSDTTGDGSSGNPWATVAKALVYLGDKWIGSTTTVTILLADGTYTVAPTITVDHPCGSRIVISGTNTYSKTMSSVQSSSGSTGAWSVVCNLNSVADIAVNDYVLVSAASGGDYPTTIIGCHKVTNVDTGNVRITIDLKSLYTSAPSAAVSATVIVCKAVLSFGSTDGIALASSIGGINKLVLVGDYAASNSSISVNAGGVLFGVTQLGITNWNVGFYCSNAGMAAAGLGGVHGLTISYCRSIGISLYFSAQARLLRNSISGCTIAIYSAAGLGIFDSSVISGCGDGVNANVSSVLGCFGVTAKYNTGIGIYAVNMTYIIASSSTVSNNGTDMSPAANTQGNNYSLIYV